MLKKAFFLCLIFIFLFSFLGACHRDPKSDLEQWQLAYLDFLEIEKENHLAYALVYVDDDDIPELYMKGDCEATGDSICSYKNGTIIEENLIRVYGGMYIEKSGQLINRNGNMGVCHTHAYMLTDEGFNLTFTALEISRVEHLENDEMEFSYEFFVEDVPVDESEYNAAISVAFDLEKSKPLYENDVEYDEIVKQITCFNT